jgi:hypothetical protein
MTKIFRNKKFQIFSMEAIYTRRNVVDTSQMQNKLFQKMRRGLIPSLHVCTHGAASDGEGVHKEILNKQMQKK